MKIYKIIVSVKFYHHRAYFLVCELYNKALTSPHFFLGLWTFAVIF